ACSAPPTYKSTGNHFLSISGSANCSVLLGSINLKKYQLLPAHCAIVLFFLLPFIPVFGSTTCIQSLLARGDSQVPDGLISFKTAISSGCSSSFTAFFVPS